MGGPIPKQYLPLLSKPLALYSYELFLSSPLIAEIIVVCEPRDQSYFPGHSLFALPGARRQDSVHSGALKATQDLVLIHDAARPLLESRYLPLLVEAAVRTGAAALATPVTSTLKQVSLDRRVEKTIDRASLWEMQTPQIIRRAWLLEALAYAQAHALTVTDDLALLEAIGYPAEIVPSSPRNLKITTPFDLTLAEQLLLCATN